jgi:hypothetical protein
MELIKIENNGYQDIDLDNSESDCIALSVNGMNDFDLIIIARETIPNLIELLQKEIKKC